MRYLYATISHLKVNHIVYILLPAEKNLKVYDPGLPAASLVKTEFLLNSDIYDAKKGA